jgi:hypothetical protein
MPTADAAPTADLPLAPTSLASVAEPVGCDTATESVLTLEPECLTDHDEPPVQRAMALPLRELIAASLPPEPPIWPMPWQVEAAAPWWQRAWRHAEGAWIGTALAALLVIGLLGAGMSLRLTPPHLATTTHGSATTLHPAAHATSTARPAISAVAHATTTLLSAPQPAPAVHPLSQPSPPHSPPQQIGSGGHGHGHK